MGTKERCRREKMVPEASTSDSEAPIQETRQPLAAPEACHLCGGAGEGGGVGAGMGKMCVFGAPWREDIGGR